SSCTVNIGLSFAERVIVPAARACKRQPTGPLSTDQRRSGERSALSITSRRSWNSSLRCPRLEAPAHGGGDLVDGVLLADAVPHKRAWLAAGAAHGAAVLEQREG